MTVNQQMFLYAVEKMSFTRTARRAFVTQQCRMLTPKELELLPMTNNPENFCWMAALAHRLNFAFWRWRALKAASGWMRCGRNYKKKRISFPTAVNRAWHWRATSSKISQLNFS